MKKFYITRVIFLIIFLALSIGITIFLIYNNKPATIKTEETLEKSEIAEAKNFETISLDDTYDLNDLNITEYTTTLEDRNFETKYISETEEHIITGSSDVEINYFQIDGLLDESIEIAINYSLKNDVESKVNEILDGDDFFADMSIGPVKYSNFENTLSIYYFIYYLDKEGNGVFINIPENFDLNTGNRLKLDDIIINNQNVCSLIAQKIYNSALESTADVDMVEDDYYFTIESYNDIEEEIAKLIYNFKNGNEIDFVFDEKGVFFLDYNYDFLYRNCLDDVTIYNKFSENYIFDGTYSKLKNLPVLINRTDGDYQIIEEGENYILDITLLSDYDKNAIAGETSFFTNYVDEEVQKMKDLANQNSNTFYIFNCYYEAISYNENEGSFFTNYHELKTTKSTYENTLKDKILELKRDYPEYLYEPYMYGNIFVDYLDSSIYDITSITSSYDYNPQTSELSLTNYYDSTDDYTSEENQTIWDTID